MFGGSADDAMGRKMKNRNEGKSFITGTLNPYLEKGKRRIVSLGHSQRFRKGRDSPQDAPDNLSMNIGESVLPPLESECQSFVVQTQQV